MTHLLNIFPTPVMSPPEANGPAGFTTQWHGHGDGHQANNEPGDTAADRHNFGDADAGKSDHNPTQGSAQDDFSEEAGLPLVAINAMNQERGQPDDAEDMMDVLL